MMARQLDLLDWTPSPARQQQVYMRRLDRARNMARFYRLDIQRDLFGGWSVIREWGRIGRGGQVRSTPCPSRIEAEAIFEKWRLAKARRGYRPNESKAGVPRNKSPGVRSGARAAP